MQATQGFAGYQWSLNGNALVGTTSSIPVQGSGTYAVTVTDASGCSSEASYVVTSVNALVETIFTIHPNPANDLVVCGWSNGSIELIELYDVLGRKMLQQNVGAHRQAVLDIASLSSAVYTLIATPKHGGVVVRRLLVGIQK